MEHLSVAGPTVVERSISGGTSASADNVPPSTSDDSGENTDIEGALDLRSLREVSAGPQFAEEPNRSSSDTVRLPRPPSLEYQSLTAAEQQARLNELTMPQAGPSESHAAPGFDRRRVQAMRAQLKKSVSDRLPALSAGLSALKDLDGPLEPAIAVIENANARAKEILDIFETLREHSGSGRFESAGQLLNAIQLK